MSLEQSMLKLAESNDALAEAQSRLAEAQNKVADRYEEMITMFKNGSVASDTPAAAPNTDKAPTAAEKKAAKAAKAAEAAAAAAAAAAEATKSDDEDDDGFGGDDAEDADDEDKLTHGEVKQALIDLKNKDKDKARGVNIINKYGYEAIPDIQEKDYRAIFNDVQKLLKK